MVAFYSKNSVFRQNFIFVAWLMVMQDQIGHVLRLTVLHLSAIRGIRQAAPEEWTDRFLPECFG